MQLQYLHVMQMYTLLEQHIEQQDFLKKLERAKEKQAATPGKHGDEVLHEEWWEAPPGDSSSVSAESDGFTEVRVMHFHTSPIHCTFCDVLQCSLWLGHFCTHPALICLQVTRPDVPHNEALDSYVIVQKDDVLEAIGTFVAAYLAELPEAQNLPPAQLQAALKTAFKVGIL